MLRAERLKDTAILGECAAIAQRFTPLWGSPGSAMPEAVQPLSLHRPPRHVLRLHSRQLEEDLPDGDRWVQILNGGVGCTSCSMAPQ